jgi:hypothetical protein
MSKRFFVLLTVLAAALASARVKAENWIRVSSPHFTVISNANEKRVRRIARQFERMRSMFCEEFPKLQVDPAEPIVVLAVRDKNEFLALEPQNYLAHESLQLDGLFLRASEQDYVLIRLEAEGSHPYAIVYHEYTHWLLSKLAHLPLWLDEGLAEFYETAQVFDKDALLGAANARDLLLLRQGPLLPLETLFTIDSTSPYYRERAKGSIFYAESWALAHYLYFRDFDYKTSHLNEYMQLVEQNVDPTAAATRAFGDMKHLQTALEQYIQQGDFDHLRTAAFARVNDADFDMGVLSAARVDAVKATVLAYNGRTGEARSLLQLVLQDDPGNATARETQAYLDSLEQREEEDKLRNNVRLSPLSAADYDHLAMFLWAAHRDLEEARTLEMNAIGLDPANVDYRMNAGKIVLTLGRGQDAVDVLREATKLAHGAAEIKAVNDLLRNAQGYADAQAEALRLAERDKAGPASLSSAQNDVKDRFVAGRHRSLVGVLRDVRCESARIDLTVEAGSQRVQLHSENYYKVDYSILNLPPFSELNPCEQLEGRAAKVEYVESADGADVARVLAVELRK